MPSDNLVLIDTSIWIAYFRETTEQVTECVEHLLTNGQVATAAIIVAELMHGAHSVAEGQRVRAHLAPLHWITSADRHWESAGSIASRLRRNGRNVNLTDCYIAALAQEAKAVIYSLDKHFHWIAESGGCKVLKS